MNCDTNRHRQIKLLHGLLNYGILCRYEISICEKIFMASSKNQLYSVALKRNICKILGIVERWMRNAIAFSFCTKEKSIKFLVRETTCQLNYIPFVLPQSIVFFINTYTTRSIAAFYCTPHSTSVF